jgi:hypothetical protein
MKTMISAACGFWLLLAGASAAQAEERPPIVVELYTSQGCSSCPPADALLAELAKDPRIIALALHVDYWDYLGWADRFANPAHTKRQKAYAHASGAKMIYTPQMIISGGERVVGSDAVAVAAAIRAQEGVVPTVRLSVLRQDGRIVIRAEAVPPSDRTFRVQLVRYRPQENVQIERGENAGHSITYHNIVTSWQALGDWRATQPLELRADMGGAEPGVVLIQAEGPAEILAAVALK